MKKTKLEKLDILKKNHVPGRVKSKKIDQLLDKPIRKLTGEDWLIIQIKMILSHPDMCPFILMEALDISQEFAAEILSFNLVKNILNFDTIKYSSQEKENEENSLHNT